MSASDFCFGMGEKKCLLSNYMSESGLCYHWGEKTG